MSSRNRQRKTTEMKDGGRYLRYHCRGSGNCADCDKIVEQYARQNQVLRVVVARLTTERNNANNQLTNAKEQCQNANHQINILRDSLHKAETTATKTQDELHTVSEQLKESKEATAIERSTNERLRPELHEAREAIYEVNIGLDRRICDLEADKTRLRDQKEALEAAVTQLSDQNDALEAENTLLRVPNEALEVNNIRLRDQMEALEAENTKLNGLLSYYEAVQECAHQRRMTLQDAAGEERVTEHAINPVYTTPPTTPDVGYNILPGPMPGQYPEDSNPHQISQS